MKLPTILPGWYFLWVLVMQPASTRSTTPSLNISEWMPKSLWPLREARTASGMLPMPEGGEKGGERVWRQFVGCCPCLREGRRVVRGCGGKLSDVVDA